MKNKEKYLGLLLGLLCVFGMAGCQEQVMEAESEVKTEVVEEKTEAVEKIKEAPQLVLETIKKDWYGSGDTQILVKGSYQRIGVEGEGYEALAQALKQWSDTRETDFLVAAEDYARMSEQDSLDIQYSINSRFESTRMDNLVLSFIECYEDYTGGAHGCYGYSGYTFDVQTGEQLTLTDLLMDQAGFKTAAIEYICNKLEEEYAQELYQEYADTVAAMMNEESELIWFLNGSGIQILFNPYVIGPYAMGAVQVTLPYNEFTSYIKPEYCRIFGSAVAEVSSNAATSYQGIDGTEHTLCIKQKTISEYYDSAIGIDVDQNSHVVGEYIYINGAYLLATEEGRTYLLLCVDMASNDYIMHIFDISEGNLVQTDRVSEVFFYESMINSQNMKLAVGVDVFGSYISVMNYEVNKQGKLVQMKEVFEIPISEYDWMELRVIKDIPVVMNGTETILPIGSQIRIIGTDNKGIAYFKIDGMEDIGEIHYTTGDGESTWGCFIDGITEWEYFESLPYAG